MSCFTADDLKGLWSNKEKAYFVLPMPSDKELAELEGRLGVKLPFSYKELALTSQNGGLLKRNASPIRDTIGNVIRYVKNDYIDSIGRRPGEKNVPEHWPGHEEHDAIQLFRDKSNLIEFGRNQDSYETFVLNYLECESNGEPSIAHIDRKVRRGKDNEPVEGSSDWRNINELYYWELTTIAPNFETYIKELVIMPKQSAFDFAVIKGPLKQAAQKSFREIVKAHGHEDIVAYGLYIDAEGSMVADAANIKVHLEKLVAAHPKDEDYYTYATNEWRYEGTDFALDLFDPICKELARYCATLGSESKIKRFRDILLDVCAEVLAELKSEGFFAKEYALPVLINVNISNDEISATKIKKIRLLLA